MNAKEKRASLLAVLAAALYSLTSPFSKILLSDIPQIGRASCRERVFRAV